ncbi:hypothetical protein [Methanobrevibacter curvatus]|uniref:Uncharacterized protein n=1 Tax=Methanobrevibacter curvatus TaxID=49547 RepID=A0A162FA25_9EURY|nr:hypothetical protein [Methanobrevibacter curvatus]KZX10095.1 hypothetical protein MBCUR_19210 [Methanobrevibacter curvatus]
MDVITSAVYLILLIIIFIFIFSMGLLTPKIDRKGFISLIAIGFIIGIIGGLFFITPIYDEIPNAAGAIEEIFNGNQEKITLEISNETDVNTVMNQISKIDGVISVKSTGFTLMTTNFTERRGNFINKTLKIINSNITSWNVNTSGVIKVNTNYQNPNEIINDISESISYSGGIATLNVYIYPVITLESSKLEEVKSKLIKDDYVIIKTEGPVTKKIQDTKKNMVDNNVIILLTGFVGILVALFGLYFDNFIEYIKNIYKTIYNKVYLNIKRIIKKYL